MFVDSLIENVPAKDWVAQLDESRGDYGGFNLLLVDGEKLHFATNRGEDRLDLEPGIYGLSNGRLDSPWPKVQAVRTGLSRLVERDRLDQDSLFGLLSDRSVAPDDRLPDTGVPLEWERSLSAMFIDG